MKATRIEQVNFRALRWLLIISFVVLAILPLVSIVVKIERVSEGVIMEKVTAHLSGLSEKSANHLDSYLGERLYDLRIFSSLVMTPTGVEKDIARKVFLHMQELSRAYVDFFLLDSQNQPFLASRTYDHDLIAFVTSHFDKKQDFRDELISNVFYYPSSHGTIPAVLVAIPLHRDARNEDGAALAVVDFRPVEAYVRQTRFGKTGEIYLVDKTGRFLTTPRLAGKALPERIDWGDITVPGLHRYTDYRGQIVLRARQVLQRTEWFIVAEQDQNEALEQVRDLRRTVYVLAAICISGIFLIAWAVSEWIVRRLERRYRHEKELEFQTIHKSKLAALGMLTSGMAHEVNTPLASALLYTQLLREELPGEQTNAHEQLAVVEAEIKQCSQIVRNLLDMARMSPRESRACDVNSMLERLLAIAQPRIDSQQIKLRCRYAQNLPMAGIGESVLQEVITNLIANALEAMPTGGNLSITTQYVAVLERVSIEIEDTGVGIPADQIDKLFEPFYTTKQESGTGLGLYMSHEIVKRYGGAMRFISTEAKDGRPGMTIFTVELPAAKGEL